MVDSARPIGPDPWRSGSRPCRSGNRGTSSTKRIFRGTCIRRATPGRHRPRRDRRARGRALATTSAATDCPKRSSGMPSTRQSSIAASALITSSTSPGIDLLAAGVDGGDAAPDERQGPVGFDATEVTRLRVLRTVVHEERRSRSSPDRGSTRSRSVGLASIPTSPGASSSPSGESTLTPGAASKFAVEDGNRRGAPDGSRTSRLRSCRTHRPARHQGCARTAAP